MFMLDQLTLFYFLLNSKPKPFKGGIKSWASNFDVGIHVKSDSRQGSKAGSLKSVITSQSTLIDNIIISRKVKPKSIWSASPLSENFGAFQDKDETIGTEHDATFSSPIKGSGCLTSAINLCYLLSVRLPISFRTLWQLRIPQNLLDRRCNRLFKSRCWPIFLKAATRIICFTSQFMSNSLLKAVAHGPSNTQWW